MESRQDHQLFSKFVDLLHRKTSPLHGTVTTGEQADGFPGLCHFLDIELNLSYYEQPKVKKLF